MNSPTQITPQRGNLYQPGAPPQVPAPSHAEPCRGDLRQHRANDLSRHVGQPEAATVVEKGQAFVVEPKQMQHGGMQVVHGDTIDGCLLSDLVQFTVTHTGFDTGAGHEHTEALRVVIASTVALGNRHASKFATPDHQSVINQAGAFQVRQ